MTFGGHRSAGLNLRPGHRGGMVLSRSRVPGRTRPTVIWGLSNEDHAVGNQPLIGWSAFIGEGTDDFFVVVSVIGKAVGLDDGPVCQVREQQFRLVHYAVLLLRGRPAAESYVSPAQYRMPADVPVRFDDEHGRPGFGRLDGCGESRSP